jgi:hypothetical protein
VESPSRARWRDRAHGADGRRIRETARAVRHVDLRVRVAALKERGVPVGYLLFDGEQHGFRKAENIKRALDAELYFYAMLILRSGSGSDVYRGFDA